jgi:Zn-dependent protease with chaperone function
LIAPTLARRLPPATAARLLVIGAAVLSGATVVVLFLIASTALVQLPPVAWAGDWSRPVLRETDPVPLWIAIACTLLLLPAAALGVQAATQRARAYLRLHRSCRAVGHAERLVVLESERAEAFATPAGGGRIVVTTGLLRALSPDERQALLAHERSHLRHRHSWWVLVADLSGAINPVLRPATRAAAEAVERWADEDAARAVGDRRLVARALARAALHTHTQRTAALAATGGQVPERVRALLAAPPRRRPLVTFALVGMLLAALGSAVIVQNHTDTFFDDADCGTCSSPVVR